MKVGDNNSLLGDCTLNFVQYGTCLHFSVQSVWGLAFFLDTQTHTFSHSCKSAYLTHSSLTFIFVTTAQDHLYT